MRFFHLSDLHIGLKLMNHDLREDQEYILRQVIAMAREEQPDAVLIAGDIYDKAIPSADAVEIFDHFLGDLAEALPQGHIMMISGNHDSAPRVNVFRSLLKRQNIHMIGLPPEAEGERIEKVTLEDPYGRVNFYLLPFVKPSMLRVVLERKDEDSSLSYDEALHLLMKRESIDQGERNVLVSHQFYLPSGTSADNVERMDSEIRTVGNIDEVSADVLSPFDYAALGHIHKPMKVGKDIYRYCGTPLACSVSEAGQQKEVLLVELKEKGDAAIRSLPLAPLREVRILRGTLEEVLRESSEDYVTVLLTDRVDLDVLDMQDRLRAAFPNLLEIRRETLREIDYTGPTLAPEKLEPFSLLCSFLKDLEEEEKEILQDVIHTLQEVK